MNCSAATRLLLCACLSLYVLIASGCSSLFGDEGLIRSRSTDYLKTGSIEPIQLPENVESVPLEPLYVIPRVQSEDDFGDPFRLEEYEIPRPDAVNTEDTAGVKIQKLGDERWIFVKAPTEQVWPRTQNFLSEYGIAVYRNVPALGRIETDWVAFRDDETTHSRFLLTLEKSIHPETTEIHIVQVESPADSDQGYAIDWPQQSQNEARERWMIDNLSKQLAENVDNASASLLGQTLGGESKVGFTTYQQEPAIYLHLSAGRAWASLAHSAGKDGYVSWRESEELGLIYIGYSDNEANERSWFSRAMPWNWGKGTPKTSRYSIEQLLAHLSGQGEVKTLLSDIPGADFQAPLRKQDKGYLIVIKRVGDRSIVVVRDERGRMLERNEAKIHLRRLRKNLI